MALRTQQTERDAVVAILEDDSYGDAADMAEAIVKTVHAELSKRTVYAVFPEAGVVGYGPYPYQGEAVAAWEKEIGAAYAGHRGRLLTLRPWNAETEHATVPCVCGHKKDQHTDRGGCAVFGPDLTGPRARVKPYWPQCDCGSYQRSA